MACLVDRRTAASLGILLTVSIEAALVGFGFDIVDVYDLVTDGIGIVMALLVHRWLAARFPILRGKSMPDPVAGLNQT